MKSGLRFSACDAFGRQPSDPGGEEKTPSLLIVEFFGGIPQQGRLAGSALICRRQN